jgi:hypothetical protein
VACVDFSENSIRAAYRAADIAFQDNAVLELFHIYRSPIYAAALMSGVNSAIASILNPNLGFQCSEILMTSPSSVPFARP